MTESGNRLRFEPEWRITLFVLVGHAMGPPAPVLPLREQQAQVGGDNLLQPDKVRGGFFDQPQALVAFGLLLAGNAYEPGKYRWHFESREALAEARIESLGSPLAGRGAALIFEKPSTRTRVSFDVGVRQMGGQTMVLSRSEMQLRHGETIADTGCSLKAYRGDVIKNTHDGVILASGGRLPDFDTFVNGMPRPRWTPSEVMLKGTANR